MAWNRRRRDWLERARDPKPPVPPTPKEEPVPTVAEEIVLIVPTFPAFSPASVSELLRVNRGTVAKWLDKGKLGFFCDNIGARYILRDELIRFVRDYLQRPFRE